MSTIKVVGIDLGKSFFHVVVRDNYDSTVIRKKLTRTKLLELLANLESSAVAFETCGGAHWLARKCQSLGNTVRLIPL